VVEFESFVLSSFVVKMNVTILKTNKLSMVSLEGNLSIVVLLEVEFAR
jgi:hypothetical protein